jgi:hypothetical protein
MYSKRRGLAVLGFIAAGCELVPGGQTTPLKPASVAADRATFDHEAAPLLERRCGDAMCHGRPERPFALYAAGARRQNPGDTFMKTPLTAGEIDANYGAALGFVDAVQPRSTTLVQKAIGHQGHKGGPVFAAPSDPECEAITNWLSGEVP